jgi:hypothetical protein
MGRSIGNNPSATVSYFGPEIVVSEAVPEPTTIAGAIFGLTSIVAIKKRQKIATKLINRVRSAHPKIVLSGYFQQLLAQSFFQKFCLISLLPRQL